MKTSARRCILPPSTCLKATYFLPEEAKKCWRNCREGEKQTNEEENCNVPSCCHPLCFCLCVILRAPTAFPSWFPCKALDSSQTRQLYGHAWVRAPICAGNFSCMWLSYTICHKSGNYISPLHTFYVQAISCSLQCCLNSSSSLLRSLLPPPPIHHSFIVKKKRGRTWDSTETGIGTGPNRNRRGIPQTIISHSTFLCLSSNSKYNTCITLLYFQTHT